MKTRSQAIIVTVLMLVVLLLVGLNSTRFFFRADITRYKENSISEVSRNLFQEIDERVVITYYVSDKLRNRAYQPQQIIDILNEYAAYSRGRIRVDVVDPVAAGVAQEAERLGVQPQQIQVIEQDQQSLAVVYSGVVIRYLDKFETIPVAFQPETLEYDLTSSIRDMVQDTSRTVGLLAGATNSSLDENFRLLRGELEQIYDVTVFEPGDPVPPSVEALVVLGGDALTEEDLSHIDAFLMEGGSALMAIDGVRVDLTQNLAAETVAGQPILEMLEHYGLSVQPELVLNQQSLRIPVQQAQGRMRIQTLEPYPHWIPIQEANVDRDHPITARFSGLDVLWASPIVTSGAADSPELTVLVRSPAESWLMADEFYTNPGQRYLFQAQAGETRGVYDLAVAYTGPLEAYAGSQGDETSGDQPESAASSASAPDSVDSTRLVVVGDSDFLSDLINVTRSGYNLDFALNATDWLTNDEDLLSIRTRAARDMRLNAVQDPERFSRAARLVEVFNVAVIPGFVILVGVGQALRRRRLSRVG